MIRLPQSNLGARRNQGAVAQDFFEKNFPGGGVGTPLLYPSQNGKHRDRFPSLQPGFFSSPEGRVGPEPTHPGSGVPPPPRGGGWFPGDPKIAVPKNTFKNVSIFVGLPAFFGRTQKDLGRGGGQADGSQGSAILVSGVTDPQKKPDCESRNVFKTSRRD